jgi:Protein of unknown function (DUF3703)
MSSDSPRVAAFDAAMATARERLAGNDAQEALALLERAHVLGQRDFGRHWRVHELMLRAAWASSDGRELRGQLLRLALTPIGHVTRRLPRGNTGRANVSAFAPMAVPAELQRLLDAESAESSEP